MPSLGVPSHSYQDEHELGADRPSKARNLQSPSADPDDSSQQLSQNSGDRPHLPNWPPQSSGQSGASFLSLGQNFRGLKRVAAYGTALSHNHKAPANLQPICQ